MKKQEIKPVKIVEKKSLIETLKSLNLNDPRLFSIHDFKLQPVRQAISDLRKKEYGFDVTEEGMVDQYIVTCTKKPE